MTARWRASSSSSVVTVATRSFVGVGAAVAVEGPPVAHFGEEIHVEVAHDQLGFVAVADFADELAFGIDEVARAVEVVVAEVFDADPVDRADVVLVGDGRRGLLELPQVRATGRVTSPTG